MNYNNKIYAFILSNRFSFRLKRHITFWLAIILFYVAQHCFEHYQFEKKFFENISVTLKFIPSKIFLTDILFCYPVIYLLVPKFFLKKRYLLFALSFITISVIVFIIRCFYIYSHFHFTPDRRFLLIWGGLIDFIFVGPFAVCGLFLAIKMLKTWYLEEEKKQMLITANANAELQLLKAQLHPHFLFNTLNNIYSFALDKSPKAGKMVLQLSDMMSYMINDCNTELVSLSKELKIMYDYIELEKVRYGNKLELHVSKTGKTANKLITPLLMIPFLENSFKHGSSRILKDPWIKLYIQADENILHFSLANSKPANENQTGKGGIGLANVRKRLELLYPQNHLLLIESTENTFTVNMQIPLQRTEKEVIA